MSNKTLIEQFLREKKDHLIKKLNIGEGQKQTLIDFFNKYPNYEKHIDWNKKDLTMDDFLDVMEQQTISRSSVKQQVKSGDLTAIWKRREKEDYKILWYDDINIYVSPLSWECAQFMNSKSSYEANAKWCIGATTSAGAWNDHVIMDKELFIMRMRINNKYGNEKYMFQIHYHGPGDYDIKVWDDFDIAQVDSTKIKDPITDSYLLTLIGPIVNNYNKKDPDNESKRLVTKEDWRRFDILVSELYDLYEEKVFNTWGIDESSFIDNCKKVLYDKNFYKMCWEHKELKKWSYDDTIENLDDFWNSAETEVMHGTLRKFDISPGHENRKIIEDYKEIAKEMFCNFIKDTFKYKQNFL